jgi:glycosyltransferase involved in cell wall biosynthesis
MSTHVLIVRPEGFQFGWRGAATRILDSAAAIASLGWSQTMLTAHPVVNRAAHSPEAAFPGDIVATPFHGDYPVWIDRSPRLRRWYRGIWKIRGAAYYHHRLATDWARRVRDWIADWPAARPSLVWAVGSQDLNSLIAGRYIADYFAAPLVLDLNDPPSSSRMSDLHPCLHATFASCLRRSSAVITTTNSYARHLVATHGLAPHRVRAIYLAYPDEATTSFNTNADAAESLTKPLTLLHAGSLHTGNGRNARSLVEALAKWLEQQPAARGHVCLRLVGGGAGGDEAQRLAVQLGLGDTVQATPPVAFHEVQSEMARADVLVVIKFADAQHDLQIPGKLFQYLPQGKPILGIMRPHTEAATILRESGCGLVVANDDIPQLAATLERLWQAHQNRSRMAELISPNVSFIEKFSRNAAIGQFVEVLQAAVMPAVMRRHPHLRSVLEAA